VGTPTTTSYADTGLSSATTYSYTVAARDAAGNISPDSASASATTADTIAPSTPTGLVASAAGATAINLTWTASTDNVGVTGYIVKRNGVQVATPTATNYSDTGLSSATTYNYTVAARDAAGNISPDSSSASATTADTTPPSTPTGLVATAATGAATINLSWTASTDNVGVTSYIVKRNGVQVATPTTTSYADTGLSSATTYSYTVAARDAAGNISPDSASVSATTTDTLFPLHTEAGKRYLIDAAGNPFLMLGESPQAMIGALSEADAEVFLANRKSHGFNTVWINLLCAWGTAWGCNDDGSTFDGIAPFAVANDLSTPNEAYFTRVDHILQLAASYGFLVVLDPAETISQLSVLRSNGLAKSRAYGQYLGTRYKDFPNIVWMSGNDFQTWHDASDDALVREVALGIKDTDPNHIHTVELNYLVSSSLDDNSWAPIISLNAAYTLFPTYANVLRAYNQSASMPVFMVEANYEFENNNGMDTGTPAILRRQEYWTALSGATGQLYGNGYTWKFSNDWKNQLDTPGAVQMAYVKALFEPRAWYELVPDQTNTVVTAGYGTFSSEGSIHANDYVTAARTPSGKLVMAYVPSARTVTVDMRQLSGPGTARWYDPTAGTFTDIAGSPFANAGSLTFTTPGTHADGETDWVLVLEVN
jgi:chitodextrinase